MPLRQTRKDHRVSPKNIWPQGFAWYSGKLLNVPETVDGDDGPRRDRLSGDAEESGETGLQTLGGADFDETFADLRLGTLAARHVDEIPYDKFALDIH